jgi:hypothetical protein
VPPGGTLFSYHRRNAYASILWALFAASLVEMIVVHLALRATAPRLALGVLALSIFGAVWILGFLRAVTQVSLVLDDCRAFEQALASSTTADRERPTLAPSN